VGYNVGSALLPIQWEEDDEEEEDQERTNPASQKEKSTSFAFYIKVTDHSQFYVRLLFG
jgi:hypothetical protein